MIRFILITDDHIRSVGLSSAVKREIQLGVNPPPPVLVKSQKPSPGRVKENEKHWIAVNAQIHTSLKIQLLSTSEYDLNLPMYIFDRKINGKNTF